MSSRDEEYIAALEEELCASIERERKLAEDDLSLRAFIVQKLKKTKLYKNILSEPDSKVGKVARAPRSFYRLIKNPEIRKSLIQKKTTDEVGLFLEEEKNILEPWIIDLDRRKEIVTQAIKEGKKIALYYLEKPDSSTFRYRCYNTFKATLDSKKWQAMYFFKQDINFVEEIIPRVSLVVLGRQSGQERIIKNLIKMAHSNGVKVGLDVDDLVFDMKYLDIMLDTIGEKVNKSYWLSYFASVQAIARQVDYFIVTNDFLAKKIKESFNKPCKVIRNSLNDEQLSASTVYVERKAKRRDKQFVMGYFSGSPTHKKDLDEALSEVLKFLDKHDNAVLKIVGFMKFSKETEKYIDKRRIVFLPMVDFRKLQRMMSEVDVNIAPLVVNDFTNCKSELKFFEAAVVETTTIASPTYTFKKAIKDGENGFLAQPGEWYEKLEYLYKNPKKNREVALAAKEYALKHYYGKEFLKEVEAAYDYFAK
ncbi:glycosyltransferase [Candidatus Saccharibacteria bacterium]|nr:glycosyltransferase [Candidatus Saccharibacteria bacterium]